MERHPDFRDVDESGESTRLVNYLDSVSSLDTAQAYKSRTFALLDVSEGSSVLEVGCGTGDDAQTIAETVGASGRVVGIDSSEAMIDEARKRAHNLNLPLEFIATDAHNLAFEDNTFNACRTDRTLQHVESPKLVLSEMVRVTRPGGVIVATEPDWGTVAVDHHDRALARRILSYLCDVDVVNGWMGRQLPKLFHSVGIEGIGIEPLTFVFTNYETASELLSINSAAQEMSEEGLLTESELNSWLDHLELANQEGHFVATLSGLIVYGRKP